MARNEKFRVESLLKNQPWLLPAIILVCGFLLYAPTLQHHFIYDDNWTIVQNPAIKQLFPLSRFFLDGTTSALPQSGIPQDVYRPLSTLSFAVNFAVGGLTPGSYRVVNILLHLFSGLLLWRILSRRFSPFASGVGALLFLLHPIQVESVVWVTQRSILLCAAATLLCLDFWDRSFQKPVYGWAAVGAYGLALLGKETAIGLPFLLFLCPPPPAGGERKHQDQFWFFISGFVLYLVLRFQVLGHLRQEIARQATLGSSLQEGMSALWIYGRNLLWPFHLNVSISWPETLSWSSPSVLVGVAVMVFAGVSAVFTWRRGSVLFLAAALPMAFFAPHLGFIPLVTYAADRFFYMPMIGAAVATAWIAEKVRFKWILILLLGFFSLMTVVRGRAWQSEIALWASSLRENPQSAFSRACYAQALLMNGRLNEARDQFELSLASRPTINLARMVLQQLVQLSEKTGDTPARKRWEKELGRL